jgi:hypothetical protein
MAFDSKRRTFVLFGGIRADSASPSGYSRIRDVFEWRHANWSRHSISSDGPVARALAALEYDPLSNAVLMLAGQAPAASGDPRGVKPCPSCSATRTLNDSWSYDGNSWKREPDAPDVAYPELVFDSRRREMLLLANRSARLGNDGFFPVLVWRRVGARWILVDSAGPRNGNAPLRPAFDERRGTLVMPMLDGPDAGMWEWTTRWRRIDATLPTGPRRRFVTAYDPARQLIVLFGGSDRAGRFFNDVWVWDGARWAAENVDQAQGPSPRSDGSLLYDRASRRLLLFGGLGPRDTLYRETWAYIATRWTRVP